MNAMISEFPNRLYTPSIKGDWLSRSPEKVSGIPTQLFVGKTKEEFFSFWKVY